MVKKKKKLFKTLKATDLAQPKHILWILKRMSHCDGSFEHTKLVETEW